MELEMAGTFDIKDTWLFMGLLAQREEAEVTRYIQEKKSKSTLSAKDIADIEYASEIRGTLREVKLSCSKKANQEKGGQYNCEALEKLLSWGVITEEELEVMHLRTTLTYREIGKSLGIATSTAYNTVERVHERVKMLYRKVSLITKDAENDPVAIEKNAKKIHDQILEAKLSVQQVEIYRLMCKGHSNMEIALALGISKETVKSQKTRINKSRELIKKNAPNRG